jgi:hypothetical protein
MFPPGFWGVRVDHFREHHGSPPGFGGFVLIIFVSTMVHPRVLGGSCWSLSWAPWLTPGFWWVRADHFREHHGSPPGFAGFVLITFVSTMVHPRVLGGPCWSLTCAPWFTPGFGGSVLITFVSTMVHPGFWWVRADHFREHHGSPRVLVGPCWSLSRAPWFTPGFGGTVLITFASTMVHPGFWWVRVDHFREHHGSPPSFGGSVLITFASTMVHPRVLVGPCWSLSRAPWFTPGFWWVRVARLLWFLCCVFIILFVFVRCIVYSMLPVSWWHLQFSLTFIYQCSAISWLPDVLENETLNSHIKLTDETSRLCIEVWKHKQGIMIRSIWH